MKNENIQNQIDDYLSGKLDKADQSAFEAAMKENPELAKEVKVFEAEDRALELLVREDLQSQLNSWKAEKEQSRADGGSADGRVVQMGARRKTTRLIYRLAAAASVLLLIGFVGYSWFGGPSTNTNLANKYFSQTSTSTRGIVDKVPDAIREGTTAMAKEDYVGAIAAFSQVQDPDFKILADLYTGESYFSLKEYERASEAFQRVIDSGEPELLHRQKAEWYLVLSYLAQENPAYQKVLDDIAGSNIHAYQREALQLRGDLE